MNGEILSIETVNKIARLEKENKQYEEIVCKFDKEVNKLFNIIKDANNLLQNSLTVITPVTIELQKILCRGLNDNSGVHDAKTIS